MNWLQSFLGLNDRKQVKRTEEVLDYVHNKKKKYFEDMGKIHEEAKLVHSQSRRAIKKSFKLIDVTTRIAIATGGLKT